MSDLSTVPEKAEQVNGDSQSQFTPQTQLGDKTETLVRSILDDPNSRVELTGADGNDDMMVLDALIQRAEDSLRFDSTNSPDPLQRGVVDSRGVSYIELGLQKVIGDQINECKVSLATAPEVTVVVTPETADLQKQVASLEKEVMGTEAQRADQQTRKNEQNLLNELVAQLDQVALGKMYLNEDGVRGAVNTPKQFVDNVVLMRVLAVSQIRKTVDKMKADRAPTEDVLETAPAAISEAPDDSTVQEGGIPLESTEMAEEEQRDPRVEEVRQLAERLTTIERSTFGDLGLIHDAADTLRLFADSAGDAEITMMFDLINSWKVKDGRRDKRPLNSGESSRLKGIVTGEEVLQIAFATGFQRAREMQRESADRLVDALGAAAIAKGQYIGSYNSEVLGNSRNPFMAHLCAAVLKGGIAVRGDITDAQIDRYINRTLNHGSIGLGSYWDGENTVKELATQASTGTSS